MRIVLVTTWFPTTTSPVSGIFVARDAAAIAAHPDVTSLTVVHLVPPGDDDGTRRVQHGDVRVLRIPMTPTNPAQVLRAVRTVQGALRGADLVHSAAVSSLPATSLGRGWGPGRRPWVHTEHWSGIAMPETLPTAVRRFLPLVRRLLRLPDLVTVVSEFAARPMREIRAGRAGGRERPTAVVPCIVPDEGGRRERPGFGAAPGAVPLELVSVASLVPGKDPVLAVQTLAELRGRGVDARLTWVGEGPQRGAAEAMVASLGVETGVNLAGVRDRAGVRQALDAADLFLLPTRGDTFCVAIAEALGRGRVVVVGARGGQGEYIDPAVGELVADRTPESYADAVERVLARAGDLTAEQIAATIGGRFAADRVAGQYVARYRDLLLR